MVLLTILPPSFWTIAKFATVGTLANSSCKALLTCLPMVFTSLPKRVAICCRFSHTVSSSTLTSSLIVSSGWYITISPLIDRGDRSLIFKKNQRPVPPVVNCIPFTLDIHCGLSIAVVVYSCFPHPALPSLPLWEYCNKMSRSQLICLNTECC